MAENTKIPKKFIDIYEAIPEEKRTIAIEIIQELKFIDTVLKDLKKKIKKDGTVENFKQGSQEFLRESPALKSYNTTLQRFSMLYKQLSDMVPKTDASSGGKNDGFEDFVNDRE